MVKNNPSDKDGVAQVYQTYGFDIDKINEMRGYNETLNNLGLKLTKGTYKGYDVKFELSFFEEDNELKARMKANSDFTSEHRIGNVITLGNENHKLLSPEVKNNGQILEKGGITQDKNFILMNERHIEIENIMHEIFHTLGMDHPKGIGGKKGIMHYPPSTPTNRDMDEMMNTKFLKEIIR